MNWGDDPGRYPPRAFATSVMLYAHNDKFTALTIRRSYSLFHHTSGFICVLRSWSVLKGGLGHTVHVGDTFFEDYAIVGIIPLAREEPDTGEHESQKVLLYEARGPRTVNAPQVNHHAGISTRTSFSVTERVTMDLSVPGELVIVLPATSISALHST